MLVIPLSDTSPLPQRSRGARATRFSRGWASVVCCVHLHAKRRPPHVSQRVRRPGMLLCVSGNEQSVAKAKELRTTPSGPSDNYGSLGLVVSFSVFQWAESWFQLEYE